MSFINSSDQDIPLVHFLLGTDLEAAFTNSVTMQAAFTFGMQITAQPGNLIQMSAAFEIGVELSGEPRLNAEPNVFGSAAISLNLLLEPDEPNLEQIGFAALQLGFSIEAVPTIRQAERDELRLNVSLLPSEPAANFQEVKARLLCDGEEIPIKRAALDAPPDQIGYRLDVTLARVSDRETVLSSENLEFQTGFVSGGETSWHTRLSGGKLMNSSFQISWTGDAPGDELTLSALSNLSDKLQYSPEKNLTMYDPSRIDQVPENSEILEDTAGNQFPEELVPIMEMRLYDLFEEILVERCGFQSFRSNLPNYRIRIANFDITAGYFSGIAPHIGQFEPLIFEVDDVIWIVDASISLPAGFPAPETLSISRYTNLSLSQEFQNLDGFIVIYSENDDGDFYVQRIEQTTESSGEFGDPNFTETEITRTFRDYRNFSNPQTTIRSELTGETRETYRNSELIGRETLTRQFDGLGRENGSRLTSEALVPNLNENGTLLMQTVRIDDYSVFYAAHPFERGKQIQTRSIRQISGLIAVDEENTYFDQNFEQPFLEAHQAGNLASGMSTRFGGIKNISESIKVLSSGQVKLETRIEDLVRNVITSSSSEVKTGDVALNAQTTRQRRVMVLETDQSTRTGKPLQNFAVGELPLQFAVPLARRKIKRAKSSPGNIAAELPGVDLSIKRGSIKLLEQRAGNLGSVLIEGFRETYDDLGTNRQKITTTLQGVKIS